MDDRREDADRVTGFLDASGSVRGFEQTGQTRGAAGADGQGETVAANGCGINPGAIVLNRVVVEEETRFEIVGAVEKEVETGEKLLGILRDEVGDDAFNGNGGINGAKFLLGGDCFGQGLAGVGFVE